MQLSKPSADHRHERNSEQECSRTELAKYWLLRHVYIAATEESIILLDARQDKYFGFNRQYSRSLAQVLHGWPESQRTLDERGDGSRADEVAEIATVESELLKQGVITAESTHGKTACLLSLPPARMIQPQEQGKAEAKITALAVMRFVWAWLKTIASLRLRSVDNVIASLEARRTRRDVTKFDLRRCLEFVQVYRRLRVFFFSERDRCLFASVVLAHFLAQYQMFPLWVVGVRSDPFIAHAWLQHEDVILTGDPEFVGYFIPILAV